MRRLPLQRRLEVPHLALPRRKEAALALLEPDAQAVARLLVRTAVRVVAGDEALRVVAKEALAALARPDRDALAGEDAARRPHAAEPSRRVEAHLGLLDGLARRPPVDLGAAAACAVVAAHDRRPAAQVDRERA